MPISRLPDEPPKLDTSKKVVSEKKIQAFINKGGTPTVDRGEDATGTGVMKSIKLNMMDQEMNAIKTLRSKRPAKRGRKITISVHDWVIEAIQEKIKREQKEYGLTLI